MFWSNLLMNWLKELCVNVNFGILQFQKKKFTHSERLYKILVHH